MHPNPLSCTPPHFGAALSMDFESALNNWVIAKNPDEELRTAAATRIRGIAYGQGTYLNLSNLKLRTLPSCISELVRVTEINLAGNKFSSLPDLKWASQLTSIDLSNNWIENIDDLYGMVSTHSVNCSISLRDNLISQLPTNGRELPFARMNLRSNVITTIDTTIIKLGTCEIDLRENSILIDDEVETVLDSIQSRQSGYSRTPTLTLDTNDGVITISPQLFNQRDSLGSGSESTRSEKSD
jgi:hypothetical protein